MIYTEKPEDFRSKFEVAGCFVEFEDTILLLHRQVNDGNNWGLPAGKVELGEKPIEAIVRELREETGIIAPKEDIEFLSSSYLRGARYDFIFHIFRLNILNKHDVIIEPTEHQDFTWIKPKEALKLNYIEDLDYFVNRYYS